MINKGGRRRLDGGKFIMNKIFIEGGTEENISKFVNGLSTLTQLDVYFFKYNKEKKEVSFSLKCYIDEHYTFLLKSSMLAVECNLKFIVAFKDRSGSVGWCGYYEMDSNGNLNGSKFTNKVKIKNLYEKYFK